MRSSSVSTLALLAALSVTPALAQQAQEPADVEVESTGEAKVIIIQEGEATGDLEAVEAAEETTDPMPTGTETDPVNVEAVGVDEVEAQAEAGAAEAVEVEPVETEAVEVEVLEEGEVAEGTPVEGQIFEQSPATFLASSLIGAEVESTTGENVGEVDDMIITDDGMVEGVVIGVGGFLGIGEKDVAVQLDQMDIRQDELGSLTFVLNATEEELEAAPEFRTQDDIQMEVEAERIENAPATGGVGAVVDPAAPQGVVVEPPARQQ